MPLEIKAKATRNLFKVDSKSTRDPHKSLPESVHERSEIQHRRRIEMFSRSVPKLRAKSNHNRSEIEKKQRARDIESMRARIIDIEKEIKEKNDSSFTSGLTHVEDKYKFVTPERCCWWSLRMNKIIKPMENHTFWETKADKKEGRFVTVFHKSS